MQATLIGRCFFLVASLPGKTAALKTLDFLVSRGLLLFIATKHFVSGARSKGDF
jgi:hypothetical protein